MFPKTLVLDMIKRMSWAKKRQFAYLGGLVLFVIIFILLPGYFLLRNEPTCFDGVKNGDELGVDCGGSCDLVCEFEASDPIVIWDESFETRDGMWSAAAYVENPNKAFAINVPYKFRLLDSKGVLIAEKEGNVYIPPKQTFVVYETEIDVGNRVPTQEFFEFDVEEFTWINSENVNKQLRVSDESVMVSDTYTKLSATVRNPTTFPVEDIIVSGIIYDIDGNAINASQTFLDQLGSGSARNVSFTWPKIFEKNITKKEVIYTILPE